MNRRYNISFGYFLEDRFHENFIRPLVVRISTENTLPQKFCSHKIEYARGGGSVGAFTKYIKEWKRGEKEPYGISVIAIDADKPGIRERIKLISDIIKNRSYLWPVVTAVPDPCIEKWLLLDPAVWSSVVGRPVNITLRANANCDEYKNKISGILNLLPTPAYFDAWQFGPELVRAINVRRAKLTNRDFKRFVDDLRNQVAPYSASIRKP